VSQGDRITLETADRVVATLFERWQLNPASVFVAGSVRRRVMSVGDIDLVAPAVSPTAPDPLYERIVATVTNPPPRASMFAPEIPPAEKAFCTAVRGLKPGFLGCDLTVSCWGGRCELKVQISRYTQQNLGWLMIEKTGPWNFGRWFLMRWKMEHGIPLAGNLKASIDNHLVGLDQKVIPVSTEDEAFSRCGIGAVAPHNRDAFIKRVEAMSGPKVRM